MSDIRARLDAMEPADEEMGDAPTRRTQERYRLVQAVRALLDGAPTDAGLRTLLAAKGRVPITKDTVEIEAGVNRRRFSGEASEHRDLSELLKELKPDHGVSLTTTKRLKRQARTIALLEQQLIASRSATAAQITRIQALTAKLKAAESRIDRLRADAAKDVPRSRGDQARQSPP